MLLNSLMASTYSGCPSGFVFRQDQRPFKDFPHLLPSTGSRHEVGRSSILSLTPYEHDDLFKSMQGLDGYSQFVRTAPVRRMPVLGSTQDKQVDNVLLGIDEQWTKQKELLQFVMSGSDELGKDCLDPSIFPDLVRIQTTADMHLLHLATSNLVHDFPSSTVSVHADGRVSLLSSMTDVKDLVAILGEFKYTKESASRKQEVVPYFRWNGSMRNRSYLSSLKLDSLITAPLKSPEKLKQKPLTKRKSKRAVKDRDLYKNNSLQTCEMLLSIMMDKKRNGKSVTNSLKKAGPALPLLLTQFSASITGTGLAVMFSVICKVACGSVPFGTSNLLTSGFGVGLFWLSSAVNKLRDTAIYISKNSMKLEIEEEEMMMRVDKGVNDIFFRAAALMAVLILRFA